MAWFRMMGADAVEYHRATVLGRADDHAGAAIAYYGTRGETPLEWGGALAARLGLDGAVADDEYDAVFGAGGPRDPVLGSRLVAARRPGVELVIAAHKSVALLGVLGRVEDCQAILDAESDATLAFLDAWFQRQGGRRGRGQARTATGGLLWARTRHATSRAGDPSPHDHVLIANLTEMLDGRGGWKALDTAAVRDLAHAATMVGRLAGAAKAVELGYAIEPDPGPSRKLGQWRIAGIADDACVVLSKRSADIDLAMESSGFASYRARQVATRRTRAAKQRDASPEALLARWRDELAEAGWPTRRLHDRLTAVNQRARPPAATLTAADMDRLVSAIVGPDGELTARKAFTRHDVIRLVAPRLYGRDPVELDRVVKAVVASPEAIPLVGQPGARGRAWATASALAAEAAVADVAARMADRTGAAAVAFPLIDRALAAKERALGVPLTAGQTNTAIALATSGRHLELVVGVAGAGKTTVLEAVRAAFDAGGYTVVGAATSGQAARTLAAEAGVDARTVASLRWRLAHGRLTLDHRTVVLLDEAGMTDDHDLLAVLAAADLAGALLSSTTATLCSIPTKLGPQKQMPYQATMTSNRLLRMR